jgi:hypothetical protein
MTLYRLTRATGSEMLQLPEAMEAAAWTDALSEVLEQLGAGGIDDVVCHLQPGGGFRLDAAGARTLVELTPTQGLAELPSIDITGALAPCDPVGAEQLPEPGLSRDAQGIGAAALARLRLRLADLAASGLDGRAAAALDHLLAVVPAESGSILVHQPATRQLRFAAARGPRAAGLAGQRLPEGAGIAGVVLRSGRSIDLRDARSSTLHYGRVDHQTGYLTRDLLAVPILRGSTVLGVVELLNAFGAAGFAGWHREAARLTAAALSEQPEA